MAAASEAVKNGLTVKVIEARTRIGGRVFTDDMGFTKVEMGS